jgi:hypothetical protein
LLPGKARGLRRTISWITPRLMALLSYSKTVWVYYGNAML